MATIIDTTAEAERALCEARATLSGGYPVAIPPETVYGLAADATNPEAIARSTARPTRGNDTDSSTSAVRRHPPGRGSMRYSPRQRKRSA